MEVIKLHEQIAKVLLKEADNRNISICDFIEYKYKHLSNYAHTKILHEIIEYFIREDRYEENN